ncbi:MAG: hypothetical protein ACYC6O_10025 [Thermoleophilia bacterium]
MKKLALMMALVSILAVSFVSGCEGNGDDSTTSAVSQSAQDKTTSVAKTTATGAAASQAGSSGTGDCPVVDGQQAAAALGGTFVTSKEIANPPANQVHCTLTVDLNGAQKIFVIWQMPAGDYEPLKAAEEDPKTDVAGVGDKAYITLHPDTQRYDMAATKAGKFTVQVTGDNEEQVKQLVGLIISQY